MTRGFITFEQLTAVRVTVESLPFLALDDARDRETLINRLAIALCEASEDTEPELGPTPSERRKGGNAP